MSIYLDDEDELLQISRSLFMDFILLKILIIFLKGFANLK